jgi:hypothetical protein
MSIVKRSQPGFVPSGKDLFCPISNDFGEKVRAGSKKRDRSQEEPDDDALTNSACRGFSPVCGA